MVSPSRMEMTLPVKSFAVVEIDVSAKMAKASGPPCRGHSALHGKALVETKR
jgi:hypothetical protein